MKNCRNWNTSLLTGLFFLLLLLCYHNSFQASWHFDDIVNIVLNKPLHIDNLRPASIKQTFFAYPEQAGKLLRPVSNFTFALNWFVGRDNVFGYHVVNFVIHFLTTLFLFQTCLLILSTPTLGDRYQKNKLIISAIAALLWSVNPVQTQAITYIVQRMASLATLFYLLGIWCYLKARLLPQANRKTLLFYFGTCLSFLLAIGSKENTVLFPVSIFLVELLFFQQAIHFNKKSIVYLLSGITLILSFTLLLGGPDIFQKILGAYETRDFTLWQRVLTEARIVVFYLSLLLYPSPLRLSITHDVQLSSSLFYPVTTLPAVLILVLLTILPLIFHRRYPLISFAILFYLLNHVVESTVIPLELLFEHRNYLPSLFLFLPLAAGIGILLQQYKKQNKLVYVSIISGVSLIIILLSCGTIARNNVWLTERSLWADSLEKSPQSTRSYINLGHGYLFQDKNYKKAFELNYLSFDKYSPTPWKDRLRAYNNLAYIMTRVGNYKEALSFYDKALSASQAKTNSSLNQNIIFNKTKAQLLAGQTDAAMNSITKIVQANPNTGSYLQLYGEMLIRADKTAEGLDTLRHALVNSTLKSLEYKMSLLDLSLVYGRLGSRQKADFYTSMARQIGAPLIPSSLCMLENSLRTDQSAKADRALRILLSQLTWPELIAILDETSPERPTLPLAYPMLRQYASDWLAAQKKS